jgi:hypothetical protein
VPKQLPLEKLSIAEDIVQNISKSAPVSVVNTSNLTKNEIKDLDYYCNQISINTKSQFKENLVKGDPTILKSIAVFNVFALVAGDTDYSLPNTYFPIINYKYVMGFKSDTRSLYFNTPSPSLSSVTIG